VERLSLEGCPHFFFQLPYLKIDIVWGRNAQNGSSGPLATGATWLIPLNAATSKRNEIKKKKRGMPVTELLNTRTR